MVEADPLRYAIFLDRWSVPLWQARCLDRLDALKGVQPVLVLLQEGEEGDEKRGDGAKPPMERGGIRGAWRSGSVWNLLPEAMRSARTGALEPVDLSERLSGIPTLPLVPDGHDRHDRIGSGSGAGPEAIRSHDLDFILHFGDDAPLPGFISGDAPADVARYGIWHHRVGDGRASPGLVGFREILEGEPVTVAELRRLDAPGRHPDVLHRVRLQTVGDSWSQNRDQILFGASGMAARVCREILAGDSFTAGEGAGHRPTAAYRSSTGPSSSSPERPTGDEVPSNRDVVRFLGRMMLNYASGVADDFVRHEDWSIGLAACPPEGLMDEGPRPRIRWLSSGSRIRYRADPFGVHDGEDVVILAEEFDYRDGVGTIVALEVRDDRVTPPKDGSDRLRDTVLPVRGIPPEGERRVHTAYPFLFQHDGETYCVPETSGAAALHLYRARNFPYEWERVETILEGFRAVDPTVFRHGGLWWLFCTNLEGGAQTDLHAWWARDLSGPWTPHALNPLKKDVRSARPAGTPFRYHGALIRPAQDCSRTYGGGVALNRIVTLTPTAFREVTMRFLTPDPDGPYPDGFHTVSAVGEWTLVDGKRWTFVPREFWNRIRRRAGKLPGFGWLASGGSDEGPIGLSDVSDIGRSVSRPKSPQRPEEASDPGSPSTPDPVGTSST